MKYARAFDHIERLTKSFFRLLFNCTETLLNICRFLMKSGITSVDKTSANTSKQKNVKLHLLCQTHIKATICLALPIAKIL